MRQAKSGEMSLESGSEVQLAARFRAAFYASASFLEGHL